jgi:DNA-directed RNA polymerase specialized sigma24 family protein
MNVPRSDIDDIVQDVLTGFFAKSPTFVYDPGKGRFRGYLKVCTYRALCHRATRERRFKGKPLHEIDPSEVAIEQVWTEAWDENRVRLALEQLRATMGHTRTFAAFEQYVLQEQPAATVAANLGLHINSVYRAREQVGRALQEKLKSLPDDD